MEFKFFLRKEVWIPILVLSVFIIGIFSVLFSLPELFPKPRYAPPGPYWSTWLIINEKFLPDDCPVPTLGNECELPKRQNIQIEGEGILNMRTNSILTLRGWIEEDNLSLGVGAERPSRGTGTNGKLVVDNSVIKSYNPVHLEARPGSAIEVINSQFINVLLEGIGNYFIQDGLDINWYVNFSVIDSRGNPIDGAEVDFDGILQYTPLSEPFLVFDKTINSIEEYDSPSPEKSYSVRKDGYYPDPYTGSSVIDRPTKITVQLDYVPILLNNIPDQSWDQNDGDGLPNAFNLNDYFYDDDHELDYSYDFPYDDGELYFNVEISPDGWVSLSADPSFSGSRVIVFSASEHGGNLNVQSNDVVLTVNPVSPVAPVVSLVSPVDGYEETQSNDINFVYHVEAGNYPLDSCTIYIDPIGYSETDNNPIPGSDNSFTINLENGIYTWHVECKDVLGTIGISEYWNLNVNVVTGVSISMSPGLANGVSWTITSLPVSDQGADGNNGDGYTSYDVSISVSGGNGVDLYIKASGDLTSDGDTIALENEKYSFSLTDPTVSGQPKLPLTTNYADNLIASGLGDGSVVYFKFYLSAPGGQAPGVYSNNVFVSAVPSGSPPPA
jgi:hypothetical protein